MVCSKWCVVSHYNQYLYTECNYTQHSKREKQPTKRPDYKVSTVVIARNIEYKHKEMKTVCQISVIPHQNFVEKLSAVQSNY